MPTILSHAVVPIALGIGLGNNVISRRLLLAGVAACIAPDLDVIGFKLGIAYADSFGHRGASHSLAFAALCGVFAMLFATQLRARPGIALGFVGLATASHPLLDMLTDGGYGVALLWPFSDARLFFPSQVIEVSPLSLQRFFGPAGFQVLQSELLWIWLPAITIALLIALLRRRYTL